MRRVSSGPNLNYYKTSPIGTPIGKSQSNGSLNDLNTRLCALVSDHVPEYISFGNMPSFLLC